MKKLLLLVFILSFCNLFSQFGAKVIYIRPTGDLGMTMKPAVSLELIYKPFTIKYNESSKWQPSVRIGFIKFSPRMDSFPVNGLIVSQTTTVCPGSMSYSKYNAMYIAIGTDYLIKLHPNFFLYPGMDIAIGGINQSYQSHYDLISDEGYQGGSAYIGLNPRIGAEYKTEKIGIFIEATRHMNLIPHEALMNYNDYGIGIRYNFNN